MCSTSGSIYGSNAYVLSESAHLYTYVFVHNMHVFCRWRHKTHYMLCVV